MSTSDQFINFDIGRFTHEVRALGPGCLLWCGPRWFNADNMFTAPEQFATDYIQFVVDAYMSRSRIRVHQHAEDGVKAYEVERPAPDRNLDFYMWVTSSRVTDGLQAPASHPMYAIVDDIMLVPGDRMLRFDFTPINHPEPCGAGVRVLRNNVQLMHVSRNTVVVQDGVDFRDTVYNAVGVTVTHGGVLVLFRYSPEPPHAYYVAKVDKKGTALSWVAEEEAFEYHNLALGRIEERGLSDGFDIASVHAAFTPSYFWFDFSKEQAHEQH